MRYLSIFSGIEAATQAWHPLGWTPVAFSEVDPFCCAVLAHHYPDVPNLGDVTKITDEQIKALGPIDLVVGGSPCQDLSVAGKRAGLAGKRSGLFHHQMRIFHAARTLCGARFCLWENVPGSFSTHGGRDFAVVVGEMAGACFGVPRNGWRNAGVAVGRHGLVEWRVLDAQYVRTRRFGRAVPQRRRRVFALLDTGDWTDRPPILFDAESLRGNPPPRREAGEGTASTLVSGSPNGSRSHGARSGTAKESNLIPTVAHALRAEGFDASEDGTGRGTPIVPEVANPLKLTTGGGKPGQGYPAVAFDLRGREGGATPEGPHGTANIRASSGGSSRSYVALPMAVRRLTPRECERLQGFPDDFTRIPWRVLKTTYKETGSYDLGDEADVEVVKVAADKCPDGPRYKALGNSFARNAVEFIGHRIQRIIGEENERI